ncbi:MAG TPA: PAS domain S-box protein, partial [Acidimicrobiales bacterium]|nr:PAS domain S-box protein [Acidimicrobiales bacterium]
MASGIDVPGHRLGPEGAGGPVPPPAALPAVHTNVLTGTPGNQPVAEGPAMLETFLSLMPDAAVAVDASGTIVAVNARTEAFFGYSAHELHGKPIELLVPERYRHAHRRQRSGYSSDPHARPMGVGLELYARRKDGSEFPVDISLAPIGAEQEPLVVAAVRDVTERKAAESALAQLAAIVESSADAIFSITRDGVITSWNPAARTMFQYDREGVLGRHIGQFFPDDPVLEDLLDAALSGRPTPSHDTRWLRQDGTPIDVAISVSLLDVRGQQGYSLLVRDITIRKAAELELRRQALWQRATAEIRLSLLSDAPLAASLELICRWAMDISGSSAALIVIEDHNRYRARARSGERPVVDEILAVIEQTVPGTAPDARSWESLFPSLEVQAFPI